MSTQTKNKNLIFIVKLLAITLVVLINLRFIPGILSQETANINLLDQPSETIEKIEGTPVILGDKELFVIKKNVGSFSAKERAETISYRLQKLADNTSIEIADIKVEEIGNTSSITLNKFVLFTTTDDDAKAANTTRKNLAREYKQIISEAVITYRQERQPDYLIKAAIYSLISTVVLIILVNIFKSIIRWLIKKVDDWEGLYIPALRISNIEFLPASEVGNLAVKIIKLIRLITIVGLFYFYLSLLFSFFPWTRQMSYGLINYFFFAISKGWLAFVNYFPNLFVLFLIVFFTYYILKLIHPFFTSLKRQRITIQGFYPDWADPTYKLVFFLVIAFALVLAFPYLPGFGSPAFQGVSVFLGLLLSLGSTAVVANIVAGTILIYTRAFQVGDRVKIGDAVGDVVGKNLLVTRIRTIKNIVITIPNGTVFSSQIINYSALADDPDYHLILNTTVTIGYDVPWRKVHQVLMDAALATEHILPQPQPFVFQTSLDDFYVSYELNSYTDRPTKMASIYSQLHQNIQDKCNEAGIEILSPHYSGLRDGNQITIPENYLPSDYRPGNFHIFSVNDTSSKNKLDES